MATGWQPNDEGARVILNLLERASNSQSNAEHQKLYKDIEEAEKHPEFCSYLSIVLSRLKDKPFGIRHRAALLLKAALSRGHAKLPAEHIEVVKTEILNAVGAPERLLRVAVSDVIATLATRRTLKQWPEVVQKLTQMLASTDAHVQLSAIETLSQLAKDCLDQIDDEAIGRPLNQLVPALIQLLGSQAELVRTHAVESLTQFLFIYPTPPIMSSSIEAILKAINVLMQNDTSVKVKTQLIRILSALMLNRPEVIAPHMQAVLSYVIDRTLESEESLAIEATDFFPDFFEVSHRQGAQKAGMDVNVIVPFLEKLLPILLRHMMYSDEMIAEIEIQEEEEEDNDQNGMTMYVGGVHENRDGGMGGPDKSSEWPIRKSAATTLEITAQHLQGTMLKPLLPMLQKQLQNEQEWKARESAILALGAVSDGCYKEMKEHLGQLMPYLFDRLKSNHYFIRSISCWAISRYCNWFLDFEDQQYLLPVIEMLLQKANDEKRFVQQAALSAFATLEETANKRLLPYLPQILTMLMGSFDKYSGRSVLIFYDVLMTLAENVGRETLNEDKYLQAIIPPLLNRWAKLAPNDKQIFPLFECLSCFSVTLGPGFLPYAKLTFERAIKLLSDILEDIEKANNAEKQGQTYKHIPKAFLIAALDLLAGLAEGIGGSMDPLLDGSPLLQYLHHCTRDISPEVRQSAFALLGELVKACFPRIKPHTKEFVQIAADNLNPWFKLVCNNASWSIGELAARLGEDMKPFMQVLMQRLIPIMNQPNWDADLLENTAITLGRLGFVCPEMLAPALPHFLMMWLAVLTQYREDLEKEHAFQGLCRTLDKNPQAVLPLFRDFINAINSFKNPRPQLKALFTAMLNQYKTNLGDQWVQLYGAVQDPVRTELQRRYGIE